MVSQLLVKAPLQVFMAMQENHGYEALRLLPQDYEPDSGSRHVAMLSNILRPQFGKNLQEFWTKLRRWINDVETYKMSSSASLESVKIAFVIQAAPRDIREKLHLQDFATFEALFCTR